MRPILLCTVALVTLSGVARGQVHSQDVDPLSRASVDAQTTVQRLASALSAGPQAIVQEILIVADTTAGTEYFLFPQPGDAAFSGIDRVAVRFTPGFDGQIIYVAYFLAGGENNPRGDGMLRVSLAGTQNDEGWITPTAFVDSADVEFDDLRAGNLNFLETADDSDWEVRENEDFFISFQVLSASDSSRVDFIVDGGSADANDDRYFPARTVLYGDFPSPNGGWLYRFQDRNNQVVAVAVANLLAPNLIAPAHSSEGLDDEVRLVWNAPRRAESYRVQTSTDPDFDEIEAEHVTTDTTQALDGLAASTKYWWRVRGENELGEGPWSNASWFSTSMTASAEGPDALETLRLDVYPNPTNGPARISIRLQRTGPTRLHVFDALGRRVEVIYEGILSRGEHTFQWNTTARPTGALFLRAEVGDRSIVRSLLRP